MRKKYYSPKIEEISVTTEIIAASTNPANISATREIETNGTKTENGWGNIWQP